jgi:hypothetical protein
MKKSFLLLALAVLVLIGTLGVVGGVRAGIAKADPLESAEEGFVRQNASNDRPRRSDSVS